MAMENILISLINTILTAIFEKSWKISTDKPVVTDYTFNIFNKQTISVLEDTYNIENYTLSPELNLQELQEFNIR